MLNLLEKDTTSYHPIHVWYTHLHRLFFFFFFIGECVCIKILKSIHDVYQATKK